MALPQLPAHVVHKLGQHPRVIQEFLSTREYAKESRPFRSALFRAYGLSNSQGTFHRFLFKYFFLSKAAYAWGRNSSARSFHSRDLACLDYPNISAPIGRNICLADAFLCLLPPNDIRVLFHEKALFLRFLSLLPLLYLAFFRREKSGRRPSEQRHNSP